MEDSISRQEAIDILDAYQVMIENGEENPYSWARLRMSELSSAQPEPQWIPCSERLPETSGSYLVSGVWASGRVAVGDCEYSSYDGYFDTAWNFDVLAWMPLPEPYREDIE